MPLPIRPRLCILALALAGTTGRADPSAAILFNSTSRTWRIQACAGLGSKARLTVTVRPAGPGPAPDPVDLDFSQEVLPSLPHLGPRARAILSQAPGPLAPLRLYLDLETLPEPGLPHLEGLLAYHIEAGWLGFGALRTGLTGTLYPASRVHGFRLTRVSETIQELEPSP